MPVPPCKRMLAALVFGAILAAPVAAADFDLDGVPDASDNCPHAYNPVLETLRDFETTTGGQLDADADGRGNICDSDLNNDQAVDIRDFFESFRPCYATLVSARPECASSDFDGSGVVNVADFFLLFQPVFGSTLTPVCENCPGECAGPGCPPLRLLFAQAKREFCTDRDVIGADETLKLLLTEADPLEDREIFQAATVFRAVSRLLRLGFGESQGTDPSEIDSPNELLDAAGVGAVGRDPLNFTATLPVDLLGDCIPPEAPLRERDVERSVFPALILELTESLESLESIDSDLRTRCNFGSLVLQQIEIDYSDVLLLRAHLYALRGLIFFLEATHLDYDLGDLCLHSNSGIVPTVESILASEPMLLGRSEDGDAESAGADFQTALFLFDLALDGLLSETDDQANDLFSVDPSDPDSLTPEKEAILRTQIDSLQASFAAPTLDQTVEAKMCGDARVDLARVFGEADLRTLLPPFIGNDPDIDSMPDATLSGALPGQTVGDLRCTLDHTGPDFELGLSSRANVMVADPYQLSLRVSDPAIGASPGHPVDPESVQISVALWSLGGGTCSSDALLVSIPQLDGSLILGGQVDVSTTGNRGCLAQFSTSASDLIGNVAHGFQTIEIITAGAIATITPTASSVASPVDVSILLEAPFGDVNLLDRAVSMNAFGCGDVHVNEQLISGATDVDITPALTATVQPGGSRMLAGSLSVSQNCFVSLEVELQDGTGHVARASYFVDLP